MSKFNADKRRAVSGAFNLVIPISLIASFVWLLWLLPGGSPTPIKTQTQGQAASAPTAVIIDTPTVTVEEVLQPAPSVIMTDTIVLVAAPELGVVTNEKQSIIRIEPGSAAEKAGLQLGDIVESIEGISVALEEDQIKAKLAIGGNREGTEMHLTVIRNGETLELSFVPLSPPFYPVEIQSPDQEPTPTITPVWPPYHYY
jgi:membrane-associated protease RseP (regulator of RpoE activity)